MRAKDPTLDPSILPSVAHHAGLGPEHAPRDGTSRTPRARTSRTGRAIGFERPLLVHGLLDGVFDILHDGLHVALRFVDLALALELRVAGRRPYGLLDLAFRFVADLTYWSTPKAQHGKRRSNGSRRLCADPPRQRRTR